MIKTKIFRGIRIRAFYDTEPLKYLLPPNGLSTYMHLVGMHLQNHKKYGLLCWYLGSIHSQDMTSFAVIRFIKIHSSTTQCINVFCMGSF